MNRADIQEFHYITPIENVRSILTGGILSHRRAAPYRHRSVAMTEIQLIRSKKQVPQGRRLHEYVNLYFCARNPMMYKRKEEHTQLCILRIEPSVIDLEGVIIADGNASSEYSGFWIYPEGLQKIDRDILFADYWTDSNPIQEWRKKRVKCSEILIPDRLDPCYITGAYVSSEEARNTLEKNVSGLQITIMPHFFFR